MKNKIFLFISLVTLISIISSCQKLDLEVDVPNCIEKRIKKFKKADVQNPPAKVWKWEVDDQTYYYIPSDCCDQFHYLYDSKCNEVCAPDGGIAGWGDGNCPEFSGTIEWTLVWEDDRK